MATMTRQKGNAVVIVAVCKRGKLSGKKQDDRYDALQDGPKNALPNWWVDLTARRNGINDE